jgi:hypothetical protein
VPIGGGGGVTVFCPAGKWTQVEWYLGTIFLTKKYDAGPGTIVRWRWFSAGIPPYWEGSFTGNACITLFPGLYTSLEFNPARNADVFISATCNG